MTKTAFLFSILIYSCCCFCESCLTWSAPTTLSSSSFVNSSDPVVAMDPSGNAAALWVENGFIRARYWSNSSWSTNIATLSNFGATSPKVKCDLMGNMTAIWAESIGIRSATLAAMTAKANIWDIAASPISAPNATDPSLDVNANNQAIAVWTRNGEIEANATTSFGVWGRNVNQVSKKGIVASNPDVSVGTNGTVVVVWHQTQNGSELVCSNRKKTFGSNWEGAIHLLPSGSSYNHHYPKVSVDVDGNADAIWYCYVFSNGLYSGVSVYAGSLPLRESSWSLPVQISDAGIRNPADLTASIRTDANGNKLAIWTTSLDHSNFQIESSGKLQNSTWSTFKTVDTSNPCAFKGDVSINQANDGVMAYMSCDGTNAAIQVSETGTLNIFSQPYWTPPVTISMGADNGFPSISTGFDGTTIRALTVWLSFNGTSTIVNAAAGSRIPIAPPTNVTVTQKLIHFGLFTDYCNTITWTGSTTTNLIEYVVFRNGTLIAQLPPSETNYEDHNNIKNGSVVYSVASVDSCGIQSVPVDVHFP